MAGGFVVVGGVCVDASVSRKGMKKMAARVERELVVDESHSSGEPARLRRAAKARLLYLD